MNEARHNLMQSMSKISARFGARARRIAKRAAYIFLLISILFGLIGYFWLPGYAKTKLETALSDALKRPVSIARISISPYSLSATIEDVKAGDVLSVGSLTVQLSYTSFIRLIPVVQEIQLDAPHLHLVRESKNRLNISDLLTTKDTVSNTPTPQFALNNISVSNGRIEWVDKVVGETQTLSDIRLGVPFIANVPSKIKVFVEPMFSAKLNGAPLELSGRMLPFASGHDAILDLTLDNLDITPFTDYVSVPLTLKSARLDTRLQLKFRHSEGHADSLAVTGDVALRNVQSIFTAQKLALDVPLLSARGIHADVFGQNISIDELALQSVGDKAAQAVFDHQNLARIGALKLSKLVLDLPAHHAAVSDVQLDHSDFTLLRTGSGSLNALDLAQAFAPPPGATQTKLPASPPPVWRWSADKITFASSALHFSDANVPGQICAVSDIALSLEKLSSDEHADLPLMLNANVNTHGTLAASGLVAQDGKADLKLMLNKIDLPALQGWATTNLNALLTRGDLSFNGTIHAQNGTADVAGDAVFNNFNVLDRVNAEDMLRWQQLKLNQLALHTQPLAIDIGEIALQNFYAQLLINPQGQLNLKGLVKDTGNTPAQSAPLASGTAKPPLPIHINKITLAGGNIDFTDQFIKPNYAAQLFDLNGHIGRLAAGTQSPVDISGKIERTAPLTISGTVDPFTTPVALNIQASAQGIDLPNLSSYSEHYLGYAIEKGKLSVDVNYRIDKGELSAENKIFLDQLTLGEKVENSTALDIPVRLAIALLQNSRGEINLDLPVRGSLNDPQFSISGIIFDVIVNAVVKAVASPFALLGSLFGGSDDISHIAFSPGYSTLTPAGEQRLRGIATAMSERPGLKIEITGFADPQSDRDGLKRAMLLRKVSATKLAALSGQNQQRGSLAETNVSADEYPLYLEQVYKNETFSGKPRNAIGLLKTQTPSEMETLLLTHMLVSDDDLALLADERAQAAQSWLTGQGNIPIDRVFLLISQVTAPEKDAPASQAKFSLR